MQEAPEQVERNAAQRAAEEFAHTLRREAGEASDVEGNTIPVPIKSEVAVLDVNIREKPASFSNGKKWLFVSIASIIILLAVISAVFLLQVDDETKSPTNNDDLTFSGISTVYAYEPESLELVWKVPLDIAELYPSLLITVDPGGIQRLYDITDGRATIDGLSAETQYNVTATAVKADDKAAGIPGLSGTHSVSTSSVSPVFSKNVTSLPGGLGSDPKISLTVQPLQGNIDRLVLSIVKPVSFPYELPQNGTFISGVLDDGDLFLLEVIGGNVDCPLSVTLASNEECLSIPCRVANIMDIFSVLDLRFSVEQAETEDPFIPAEPQDSPSPTISPTRAPTGTINPGDDPPAGWICERRYYFDGQACDCECGAYDPDCDNSTLLVLRCPTLLHSCSLDGQCTLNDTDIPDDYYNYDDYYYGGNDSYYYGGNDSYYYDGNDSYYYYGNGNDRQLRGSESQGKPQMRRSRATRETGLTEKETPVGKKLSLDVKGGLSVIAEWSTHPKWTGDFRVDTSGFFPTVESFNLGASFFGGITVTAKASLSASVEKEIINHDPPKAPVGPPIIIIVAGIPVCELGLWYKSPLKATATVSGEVSLSMSVNVAWRGSASTSYTKSTGLIGSGDAQLPSITGDIGVEAIVSTILDVEFAPEVTMEISAPLANLRSRFASKFGFSFEEPSVASVGFRAKENLIGRITGKDVPFAIRNEEPFKSNGPPFIYLQHLDTRLNIDYLLTARLLTVELTYMLHQLKDQFLAGMPEETLTLSPPNPECQAFGLEDPPTKDFDLLISSKRNALNPVTGKANALAKIPDHLKWLTDPKDPDVTVDPGSSNSLGKFKLDGEKMKKNELLPGHFYHISTFPDALGLKGFNVPVVGELTLNNGELLIHECCEDKDCNSESATPSDSDWKVCRNFICMVGGNLRFTLSWWTGTDLDLHVITPEGVHIFYSNPVDGGGALDVDVIPQFSGNHVENIFFDDAPLGTYEVFVLNYNGKQGSRLILEATLNDEPVLNVVTALPKARGATTRRYTVENDPSQ